MKTTISLPHDLFEDAERLVRSLGVSRSELYCRGLEQYLARHESPVTQALDQLATESKPMLTPSSRKARRTIERTDW